MNYPISGIRSLLNLGFNKSRLFITISAAFLLIICLTIFQDFLDSYRSGYSFYFNESLLFKTIWFIFVPILMHLYLRLTKGKIQGIFDTFLLIALPLLVHLLVLPFAAGILSIMFFEWKYDVFKFFSYTMANDFYKPVVIYTSFVLGYKYFSERAINSSSAEIKLSLDTIVVSKGQDYVIVKVSEIVQITSATPYIFIHLEDKRYIHSETLKSVCEKLDSDLFIRIHKATVVNISKVVSFKSRLNGDYDLMLTTGTSVRLSRTYATNFKKNFNRGHRVGI